MNYKEKISCSILVEQWPTFFESQHFQKILIFIPVFRIIVKNYRVIYKVDSFNKEIDILCSWHAARGGLNIHRYS